jgi:hypothetical protein
METSVAGAIQRGAAWLDGEARERVIRRLRYDIARALTEGDDRDFLTRLAERVEAGERIMLTVTVTAESA